MCIAILNKEGTLDRTTFENCWENNPHGAGIAFIENGEVCYSKEMDDLAKFHQLYAQLRKINDLPIIIHFRIATSGLINEDNCHPFEVFPGLIMAHNGIIENVEPTATLSDTRVFIDQILKRLPKNFLFNEGIKQLLSGFIDDSKLIFLNRYGIYTIINENLGHWDESNSNWYSNYSYTHTYSTRWDSYRSNRFAFNNRDNIPEISACYSCDSPTYFDDLRYSNELNVRLCPDCYNWYKNELSTPYHRTF